MIDLPEVEKIRIACYALLSVGWIRSKIFKREGVGAIEKGQLSLYGFSSEMCSMIEVHPAEDSYIAGTAEGNFIISITEDSDTYTEFSYRSSRDGCNKSGTLKIHHDLVTTNDISQE